MRIVNLVTTIVAPLVGLCVAGGSLAMPPWAAPHHGRGPHGPGDFVEEHAERLGLDEKTREAIRAIVDDSWQEAEEIRAEHREARRALRALLAQDQPDEAAVMNQAEILGALETARHKHRLSTLLRIRALLSPEQRRETVSIRDEFRHGPFPGPRGECREEIESLCGEAGPGPGVFRCLREHADRLSAACRGVVEGRRPGCSCCEDCPVPAEP